MVENIVQKTLMNVAVLNSTLKVLKVLKGSGIYAPKVCCTYNTTLFWTKTLHVRLVSAPPMSHSCLIRRAPPVPAQVKQPPCKSPALRAGRQVKQVWWEAETQRQGGDWVDDREGGGRTARLTGTQLCWCCWLWDWITPGHFHWPKRREPQSLWTPLGSPPFPGLTEWNFPPFPSSGAGGRWSLWELEQTSGRRVRGRVGGGLERERKRSEEWTVEETWVVTDQDEPFPPPPPRQKALQTLQVR